MTRYKLDIQKRQHRERSQPLNRQRLGLLEKHKDYVKRARDYHSKQDRIKKLREKASTKNPDEFYFGMINSRTEKGVHVKSRGNRALETDLVKLLKTQDFNYIKTCRAIEEKKIKKLQEQLGSMALEGGAIDASAGVESSLLSREVLGLIKTSVSAIDARQKDEDGRQFDDDEESAPLAKKTIFVNSLDAVKNYASVTVSKFKKTEKFPSTSHSKKSSTDPEMTEAQEGTEEDAYRHVQHLITSLKSRLIRLQALQTAERELEVKRALMGKGSKSVTNGPPHNKQKGLINGRDLSWYDKLDRNEIIEQEDEKERLDKLNAGIKTGARVWKWRAERKR